MVATDCVDLIRYNVHNRYLEGSGRIFLDDVNCAGAELTLISCPNPGLSIHNCAHSEDVGLQCTSTLSDPATIGKF